MKGIFIVRPLSASLFKTKSDNTYNDVYLIIKSIRQEVMSGIAKGSDNTPIWQNDKLEIFTNLQEEDRLQVQLFDYKLNNGQLIGECEILLQKIIDRKLLLTCYEIKTVTNEIIGQLSMEIEFKQENEQNDNNNQKILKTEEINNSASPSQTKTKNSEIPIISTKQAYTVPSTFQQQQNQNKQQQQQQYYQPQQNKITNSIDGSTKNKLNTTKDNINNNNNYAQTLKYESDKKIIQQKSSSNFSQGTTTASFTNNSQYTNTPVPNLNQKQINAPQVQQFAINERKTNSIMSGNSQIKNNSTIINTPSKNSYPQNRPTLVNQQNLQKGTIQPQTQAVQQPNQLYPPQTQQIPQQIYQQPQQYGQPQVMGIPQQQPMPQQAMQQVYQNAPRQQRQSFQGPSYGQQQYIRKLY